MPILCAHYKSYWLPYCCYCSSFPNWLWRNPFLMGLQWKGWTKATVLVLCNSAFQSSTEIYESLHQSELDKKWVSSSYSWVFSVQKLPQTKLSELSNSETQKEEIKSQKDCNFGRYLLDLCSSDCRRLIHFCGVHFLHKKRVTDFVPRLF